MSRTIGDTKLLDACRKPGCPVCRCVDDDSRRHVDGLLHELVTDPDTRSVLRASWGFCNWHGWMALAVPGARTGVATLHGDVLRATSERLRRANRGVARTGRGDWRRRVAGLFVADTSATEPPSGRRGACVVCLSAIRGEDRYVRTLCLLGEDETVSRAYDASDGLCLRHLHMAMERRRAPSALIDRTLRKWDELAGLLDRFVEKHEYRNTMPFTEAEARACERAVETVSGRPGVWPSDLHSDPRRRQAGAARRRRA